MSLNHKHVDQAVKIIAGLKWCAEALSAKLDETQNATLKLQKPSTATPTYGAQGFDVALGLEARRAAFKVWREAMLARQGELRREAAQIQLNVDGL